MTTTKYHTFDVGSAGSGKIDLFKGELEFIIEIIPIISNTLPLGVNLTYKSESALNSNKVSYGRGFTFSYDPEPNPLDTNISILANSDGTLHEIVNSTSSERIKFEYENNKLSTITDTRNLKILFSYNGDFLTSITYPNGDITQFSYTGNLIKRVILSSKIGLEFVCSNNKVVSIKNISYLAYAGSDEIIPSEVADLSQAPLSEDNQINFSYSTYTAYSYKNWIINLDIPGVKTTVTNVKANNKITYYFTPIGVVPGLELEEVSINGKVKSVTTYSRPETNKETICYNQEGADEVKIIHTYNSDNRLANEIVESYFDVINDGHISHKLFKKTERTFYYGRDYISNEITTVTVKTSKTAADNLSKTTTTCDYDNKGKPEKIIYPNGMIQEKTDAYNYTEYTTYNSSNLYEKFYNCHTKDSKDRIIRITDESSNIIRLDYIPGTGVVNKITDPDGYETEFGFETKTYNVNSVSLGGSQNNIGYAKDFLTQLQSSNSNYKFNYDSKGRKTAVLINDVPYVSYSYTEEPNGNQIITAKYANDEEYVAVADKNGKLLTLNNQLTPVLKYAYDAQNRISGKTDGLANLATRYVYDTAGNIIASEDDEIKSTISTNNNKEVINTKFSLKKLDLVQEYNYEFNNGNLSKVILPGGATEKIEYDYLYRINKIISPAGTQVFNYLKKQIAEQTHIISAIEQGGNIITYTYDNRGNISEVYKNGELAAKYSYDAINRLSREDNKLFNKSWTYSYDTNGNILSKTEFDFSLEDLTDGQVIEYTYSNDKLLSFKGETCDNYVLGNPATYRNKLLEWTHISNLKRYDSVGFEHNASGLRTKKIIGNDSISYYYSGDKLLAEKHTKHVSYCGDDLYCGDTLTNYHMQTIEYLYGINGITGFILNGNTYYYRKNLQGDVTHILDSNGAVKAEYVYDAWGNHEILTNIDGIGSLNPIRYRGYYFDTETGLFYLQNRYYDPQTGRFINQAPIETLNPQVINGLNLYAYCLNNPVSYAQDSGTNIGATSSPTAIDGMISNVTSNQTSSLNLSGAFGVLGGIIEGFGWVGDVLGGFPGFTKYSSAFKPLNDAIGTFGRRMAWLGFGLDVLGSAYNRFSNGFSWEQAGLFTWDTLGHGIKAYGTFWAGVGVGKLAAYAGLSTAFALAAFTPVGWAIAGGIAVGAAIVVGGIFLINTVGNFFDNLWKSIFG